MMKSLSLCAAAACLLAACAETPNADGQQQLTRAERQTTTGSMLPRRHGGSDPTTTINKDQIDQNQILNQGAVQPHVGGG
jgi:hypothetical protein